MSEKERIDALIRAAHGLRAAIMDPGPAPKFHYQFMGETFSKWPTLARAVYDVIDKLEQVQKGEPL